MAYASIYTEDGAMHEQNLQKASGCHLSSDEKLFVDALLASQRQGPVGDYFEPLLAKYPKDDYLNLWIMFSYKDVKRSTEIGEMLIKRNPKFAPAYNILGYRYMAQDNLEKAEANFNKYISLRPDLANVYDSKADYLMRVGKIEEAAALYEKAVGMGMAASKGKAEMARLRLKYPAPSDEDIQQIKSVIHTVNDGHEKNDIDAILENYSDQAIEISSNQMVDVSKANIRKRMEGTFMNRSFTGTDVSIESVMGTGPIAVVLGNSESTFKLASTGETNNSKGYFASMIRKQADGKWRFLVHHWIPRDQQVATLSSEDISAVREVLAKWEGYAKPGEIISKEHLDNLESIHSRHAIEIRTDQRSNVGIANILTRWSWVLGGKMEANSLGTLGVDGLGRKAIAWGIGKHNFYPKGSEKLNTLIYPWAMILSKEDDDMWKILAIHWKVE